MFLKSLELQGFKTFPDKTTLDFEPGVTSVVGPNGSGKSNISDAMRWVLGEQSVRVLRCSKMEDVIFSGTPGRRAQGFAQVTLTIDNSDRKLPFDDDTVAVTRRYYRSGESEYLINKATVRLKDINELFMDTGLGRDGYSIIGQGKIDSIVAARSEDRREIFEEAAGISRYRYRKEEAERRLQKAEENLVRLRDILSELEGRVEPLRLEAQRAQEFISYDQEKKGLEIGIWLETLERSGKVLREHEEKIEIAKAQHQQLEEELAKIAEQIEGNFQRVNECTAQMELARSQAASLDEQAVRTEGEIGLLKNDISHHRGDIERLEGQIASTQSSEAQIDREIEEKREEAEAREKQIEESREKLISFEERLEKLRETTDEATRKIELAAVTLSEENARLAEARIRLSSARSSMEEILLRREAVKEGLQRSREKKEAIEKEGKELEQMLVSTQASISSHENSIKGYELRLESRRKKAESVKEELDQLTLDANEQLRKAKLLEDLERNLEGFAQSVKAVMKESERGLLSGVCGPVTKLLEVPREYAVALETALGAAMQNIAVETEQDAKKAIGFLKQRDLGRATFLPLTTIRGSVLDQKEIEELPGFVGIASELCSCDQKYDGIRRSLLGRIAVAEDLDSAAAIAKRTGYRFRIVSLDGQVVNAGGSFTGGSRAKNSGLLSRASEIKRVREKAAQLQKKAEQCAQTLKERQTEVSACEGELAAARGELAVFQEERIRIQAESARVEKEMESALQEEKALRKEEQDSSGRLEELKAQEADSSKQIKEGEEAVQRAQQESQELIGNREELNTRYQDVSSTIQEIRLGEISARKDRDAFLSSIEELERRKSGRKEEVGRLQEEIQNLNRAIEELQNSESEKKEKCARLREQAQKQREAVADLSEKRSLLEKGSGELRAREREISANRENTGHELARLQERRENLQKEYDGIISRLWEDYELTRREAQEQGIQIENLEKAQRRLSELKNKIRALGPVNVGAVVEYEEVSRRYEFLKSQTEDVEQSKKELLSLIDDLTGHMKKQFEERFVQINRNFGAIFRELFGGGGAELSFTNPEDVLSSGIEIKVQPPGKIVTHIESLSGGEKALVAISIYFAIMRVNPPPFCVLDEIEAALDDVNVTRCAQYLRRMSANSQFITITHRRGTMESSDMLYGVTMQDQGISKLLALKTEEAAELGT